MFGDVAKMFARKLKALGCIFDVLEAEKFHGNSKEMSNKFYPELN